MKNLFNAFVLVCFLLCFSNSSIAQCKRFTEKKCIPNLSPYTNNGQINNATFFEGDSASLVMTFYSLLDYRLIICSHESLGEGVYYKVEDEDGFELYNSLNSLMDYWDFRVNSTQDLMVKVIVPENEGKSIEIPASGCVSIVVGFKE